MDILDLDRERGTILNESYSLDEYVRRRSWYLSKLPAFQNQTQFFYGVREADAAAVYGADDQVLSVQDVRRREEASLISPLLPLPTTGNTQTLDNFGYISGGEWTSKTPLVSLSPDLLVRSSQVARGALPSNMCMTTPQDHSNSFALLPHPAVSAYSNRGVAVPVKSRGQKRKQPDDDNTRVDCNSNNGEKTACSKPNSPHTLSNAQSPSTKRVKFNLHKKVPIVVPELLPSQNNKRAAIEVLAPDSSLDKKQKVSAPPQVNPAEKESSATIVKRENIPRKTKRAAPAAIRSRIISTSGSKSIKPDPDRSNKRVTLQRRGDNSIIDRIVAGTRLPFTPEEAQRASSLRYQRLLVSQQSSALQPQPNRSKPTSATSRKPDLLPEYHFPHNYIPRQATDAVRCICSCTHDDGSAMVACEGCDAWQHIACMQELSSVPENPAEEPYLCHVCDPFAHRLFLARWRLEHPLRDGNGV